MERRILMGGKATEAKTVLEQVFGRDLAEAHAARQLDAAPEPVYRVRSEYDPHERGLRELGNGAG